MNSTAPMRPTGNGPPSRREGTRGKGEMSKKRTGHFVVSTHWDREWYEPFQDYRFRLVNMMDELLDTLRQDPNSATSSLTPSHSDRRLLEIRPEREDEIRELAEAGRLRIGRGTSCRTSSW